MDTSRTVAIYVRVSTEEQAREGFSLENQETELKRYAARNDMTVHAVYRDTASGYSLKRKYLSILIEDAKAGKFGSVVVWKIDRLSRNVRNIVNLIDEMAAYGTRFISATEQFDTATAAGKLQLHVLSSVAQFERDRIIERVKPGMITGVRKGHWQGARHAPFGYKYNKQAKLLEPVPAEVETVRTIFRMYLDGLSTAGVARTLNASGHKARSGLMFYSKFIAEVLKNQVYIGVLVWNRKRYMKVGDRLKYVYNPQSEWVVVRGPHEPIVDDDTFRKAQARIRANSTLPPNMMPCVSSQYLLTGVLKCGYCGSNMTGARSISNHRTGVKRRRYGCALYKSQCGPHDCKGQSIDAERAEHEIMAAIKRIVGQEKIMVGLMKAIRAKLDEEGSGQSADLIYLKSQLEDVQRKRDRLLHEKLDGSLDGGLFKRVNADLYEEEKRIYARVRRMQHSILSSESASFDAATVVAVLGDFENLFPSLAFSKQKLIVHSVIDQAILHGGEITSIEYNEPFKSLVSSPAEVVK